MGFNPYERGTHTAGEENIEERLTVILTETVEHVIDQDRQKCRNKPPDQAKSCDDYLQHVLKNIIRYAVLDVDWSWVPDLYRIERSSANYIGIYGRAMERNEPGYGERKTYERLAGDSMRFYPREVLYQSEITAGQWGASMELARARADAIITDTVNALSAQFPYLARYFNIMTEEMNREKYNRAP